LRWSVERAGLEFGLSSNTLRKALGRDSARPDADGFFSTAQIISALYGAMYQEKLRAQRARAQQIELENAITTGSVLDRASLTKAFAQIADAFTSRLNAATEMPRKVRDDLLRDLSRWPLALEDTAKRQTRLPRNGNGERHNGDVDEDTNDGGVDPDDHAGVQVARARRKRRRRTSTRTRKT
jgi:hypothetical protein